MEDNYECNTDDFIAIATIGERGQLVIPAEARHNLSLQAGDKVLILRHPSGQGLVLFKIESARRFLQLMLNTIERAQEAPGTESSETIP